MPHHEWRVNLALTSYERGAPVSPSAFAEQERQDAADPEPGLWRRLDRPVPTPHLRGYLAYKKLRPPRTLQWDYAWGPMVTLGKEAVSYECFL